MTGPIACFGEVLLRLNPPGRELLMQTPALCTHVGGAEANVAVTLARLGTPSRMISVLPENALGRGVAGELRRHDVDTSGLHWTEGRMGLYFLTSGAVLLPSEVLYDRAGSAFALAEPGMIDWRRQLAACARLHLSGITAALGPAGTQASIDAARTANDMGIPVSFDCNFRAKLWGERARQVGRILEPIVKQCDLLFATAKDLAPLIDDQEAGDDPFEHIVERAFGRFPKLHMVAETRRAQHTVDRHDLSAAVATRDGVVVSRNYVLSGIVDRVGSGDAFVGAFLHRLSTSDDPSELVEFALAAAALKHGIPGDHNLVSGAQVQAVLDGEALHVRR